jgi:hypothetical protein
MTYTPLTDEQIAYLLGCARDMEWGTLAHDIEAAVAEIRALRSDKARLDWLTEYRVSLFSDKCGFWSMSVDENHVFVEDTPRAAIDAAMKEGRG